MKKVEYYIHGIKDEICGALEYAEKYICYKTVKPEWAEIYGKMATAEINHANYLKTIGESDIKDLSWISESDKEAWEKCLAKLAEKEALARLMLSK